MQSQSAARLSSRVIGARRDCRSCGFPFSRVMHLTERRLDVWVRVVASEQAASAWCRCYQRCANHTGKPAKRFFGTNPMHVRLLCSADRHFFPIAHTCTYQQRRRRRKVPCVARALIELSTERTRTQQTPERNYCDNNPSRPFACCRLALA
jgi:hypothetical protein